MEIKRHELKNLSMIERNLERFESTRVLRMLSFLEEVPDNLGSAYRDVLGHANRAIVLGKPKELIVEYLFLALQLCVANFVSALDLPIDYHPIMFRGETYPFGRKPSRSYIGTLNWSDMFYLATILRVGDALQILRQIPSSMMRDSDVIENEVDFLIVDFLQAFYTADLGDKHIGDFLLDAMRATDPETLPERRHDYILDIKCHELMLYGHELSNDEAKFNQELLKGLESHKHYWSHPDRAYNPKGWISLPLLTISVIAYHNRKFQIQPKSDYLPLWLVHGEF